MQEFQRIRLEVLHNKSASAVVRTLEKRFVLGACRVSKSKKRSQIKTYFSFLYYTMYNKTCQDDRAFTFKQSTLGASHQM